MAKYKDFDLSFINHPVTGDIGMKYDEEAIKASIINLVMIAHYEKPFHPEIGCSMKKLLFEFISPITALHIKNLIMDTINNFEPRAKIYKLMVVEDYINQGYNVSIWFYFLDKEEIIELKLPLRRTR